MQKIFKLQYQIPLIVVIFVLISIGISYTAVLYFSKQEVVTANKKNVAERLNFLQGATGIFIRENQAEKVRKMYSSFSSEEDLEYLIAVDKNGRIIASNKFTDIDELWVDDKFGIPKNILSDVIEKNSVFISYNKKTSMIDGFTSLCRIEEAPFAKLNCGFIFYRKNLKIHFKRIESDLFLQMLFTSIAILIGTILLVYTVDILISKNTELISDNIRKFVSGDRNVKIRMKGKSELVDLAKSINSMFADIATGEYLIKDSEARLSSVINTIIDGIIVINSRGLIEAFNPAAEKLFGYKFSEVRGQNVKMLMPEPHKTNHDGYLNNYKTTGVKKIIGIGREVEGQRKDGTTFPMDLAVSEMFLGNDRYFTGIIRDITERIELVGQLKAANEELSAINRTLNYAATTDGLTGLFNRRYFDEKLHEEVNRSKRTGSELSLLLCDIDHFKLYNDFYGHQKGDSCLIEVSKILLSHFKRGGEFAARYGGEEFVVVLPGMNSSQAFAAAENLRNNIFALNIPHEHSKTASFVTLSIGVASVENFRMQGEELSPVKLISMADEMLYRAKKQGRNRSILYPGN